MKVFVDKPSSVTVLTTTNKLVNEGSFVDCMDGVDSPDLLSFMTNDVLSSPHESTIDDREPVLTAAIETVENLNTLMMDIQQCMPLVPMLTERSVDNKLSDGDFSMSLEQTVFDKPNVTRQSYQAVAGNLMDCFISSSNENINDSVQLIDKKHNASNLTTMHQKLTDNIAALPTTDDLKVALAKTEDESVALNDVIKKWLDQVNDHQVVSNKTEQSIISTMLTSHGTHVGNISQASEAIVPKRADLMFTLEKIEQLQDNAASNKQYHVSVKVAPQELGPITAKIKMDKNKAVIDIIVNNAHVKGVMEANLSALKAQLSQSSIHIESINVQEMPVFQQSQQEQSSAQQHHQDALNGVFNQSFNVKQSVDKSKIKNDGLIDTYI